MLLVGEGSVIVDTDWMYKDVDSLQRTPHYDVCYYIATYDLKGHVLY